MHDELEIAYAQMAADEAREAGAEEWIEGLVGDIADEPDRDPVGAIESGS